MLRRTPAQILMASSQHGEDEFFVGIAAYWWK